MVKPTYDISTELTSSRTVIIFLSLHVAGQESWSFVIQDDDSSTGFRSGYTAFINKLW